MKIVANFDRAIAETLQDRVKARLTFKVGCSFTAAYLSALCNVALVSCCPYAGDCDSEDL